MYIIYISIHTYTSILPVCLNITLALVWTWLKHTLLKCSLPHQITNLKLKIESLWNVKSTGQSLQSEAWTSTCSVGKSLSNYPCGFFILRLMFQPRKDQNVYGQSCLPKKEDASTISKIIRCPMKKKWNTHPKHLKHHQLPDGWTAHGLPIGHRPQPCQPPTLRAPSWHVSWEISSDRAWHWPSKEASLGFCGFSSWDMKMGILCTYI